MRQYHNNDHYVNDTSNWLVYGSSYSSCYIFLWIKDTYGTIAVSNVTINVLISEMQTCKIKIVKVCEGQTKVKCSYIAFILEWMKYCQNVPNIVERVPHMVNRISNMVKRMQKCNLSWNNSFRSHMCHTNADQHKFSSTT